MRIEKVEELLEQYDRAKGWRRKLWRGDHPAIKALRELYQSAKAENAKTIDEFTVIKCFYDQPTKEGSASGGLGSGPRYS